MGEGENLLSKSTIPIKRLGWSGVVLMLCGMCSFAGSMAWYRTRTWHPLDVSVPLSVGHFSTSDFTTNVSENFTIQLEVDVGIPKQDMETVLGIDGPLAKADEVHGFKLAWALTADGKEVKREVSDGHGQGYWRGNRVGRLLGNFLAERGKRYRLDLDILEDGSRLGNYHPRLKVGTDIFALDGHAIREAVLEFVSLAIVALGVVLFLLAIFLDRRRAQTAALPAH
jgi:hypothetical protein